MKNRWKRLISASLALVLAGSMTLPALADVPEISLDQDDRAELLDVTAGSYSPDITVEPGKLYTLIALPFAAEPPQVLTAADLVSASGNALFIGSATANAQGRLTFQDVRLRTAEAAVYYVTGPGLEPPYREATGASTSAEGLVRTASQDSSATITLVDKETDYRYNTGIYSDQTGYYSTGHLAPGKYKLRVEKPGYLPYLSASENQYLDVTSGMSVYHDVDISANVGDVTGDGLRDMTDMAALLTYYGGVSPQSVTADLDYSGQVDAPDAALLAGHLSTGTQANVSDASIVVQDGGGVDTAGLRFLSFEVDTDATVSAAAFSLTFQNHDIQLLTPQGGLTAPVDGGTLASCLAPADGFTARLISWKVGTDQTTLSFAVTADKPQAAGQVARFFYRPITGSTESFYNGVFALDHAAALVGKDTVVTQKDLIYPGSNDILLDSISIDQKPAPGGKQVVLTIPAAGNTNFLPLTVTGHSGQTTSPDLKGVSWSLDKSYGEHVTMNQNLLTITSGAPLGDVVVRGQFLSHGAMLTDSIVVSLQRDTSTPGFVKIFKNSTLCNQDELTCTAGSLLNAVYTAQVCDQYGDPLAGASQVTWSLVDAPAGLSVKDGSLVADWNKLAPGNHTFTLCAQTGAVQATVSIALRVEAKLGTLVITGPASATLPASGSMTLNYTVSALDQQGRPMELDQVIPSFSITPTGKGVDASRDSNGNYIVNISAAKDPAQQAGRYTLTSQVGDVKASFTLTLLAPETPTATRVAIFEKDGQKEEAVSISSHTLAVGQAGSFSYTAKLLDASSQLLGSQTGTWQWSLSAADSAITLPTRGATATLTVANTLAVGHYAFTLTATETKSGLTVTLPVNLTVIPMLSSLTLSAPATMTIPTGQTAAYTLPLAAFDAAGDPMDLPTGLTWSVTKKGSTAAPNGVTVDKGVLTVSPEALPGDITVTASTDADSSTAITASAHITLTPPGNGMVLALYRQITVDGKTVQANAPALNTGDDIHIREGQSAVITYTAMLVDQSTNQATPIGADKVKWMGGQSVFTVDGKAQVGVYTTAPIAVYDGLTAGAYAKVSVYPNITDLKLDFGTGHSLEPPYTLVVPSGTPQTYTATVMATILRDGKSLQLPLRELGLADYQLETLCYYTGVYVALDKTAGALHFTVDPVAIQNPMDSASGNKNLQALNMTLTYFPGESLKLEPIPFLLSKETLTARNAFLRRGLRSGSRFVFDTPKEDRIAIPTGIFDIPSDVFSSCYALELLDQYNRPMTDQGDVTWTLDGAPKDAQGKYLVTLFSPGESTEKLHANYSSIRRLRVSAQTPAGTYPLTLSASCGAFKRSLNITLEVTPGDAPTYLVALPECGQQIIPRTYKSYNSVTPNPGVRTLDIAPILYTADGLELDPTNHTAQWSVTHAQNTLFTGVTVTPNKDNTTQATVTIDRTAKMTDLAHDDFLLVNVTVKTPDGKVAGKADSTLELTWDTPIPTIMQVLQNNKSIEHDAITVKPTDTVTRTYTFALWDQYGSNRVPLATRAKVEWRISNPASKSNVTSEVIRDKDSNIPSLKLTVNKLSKTTTVKLTAAIIVPDANVTGGQVTVYKEIPVTITVNSQSSGDGNGGGGGGGGGATNPSPSPTPAPNAGPPASLTINGSTTLSATQGSQASRTFTATLKDAKGQACALSYDAKVTWSAAGLSGGLTFNTATRVLTVPATTAPGTYKVAITAAYSSTIRQTINVTVTVQAKDATTTAPTDVTLAPPVTQNGVTGTATLTPAQEQALLAATGVSGGTVTIVPSGGNGLTSLSVSLTSATATAIATQRNQSLRIQCVFGTVVLSPQALKALAAKGGKTTTITISSTTGALKVDFSCGASAASLPGSIILNAYTQGNVALKVEQSGAATVLKKALVEEGKIYTYLTGSTQLKLESRSSNFADTKGHWAQSAIDFTVARELFQGTSATTFDPGGNMTRSMVVTVLHRLEDTPAPAAASQFADVAQGSWYTDAISWANAKGIVQGTNAGFKPNDPVTREQLATILYRYASSMGLSTSSRGSLSTFSDQGKVSSWARDAMEWAVGQGLINGKSGGLLDPGGYASRAEVSTILERLIRSMVPVV